MMHRMEELLRQEFRSQFGLEPIMIGAPGRINLIGEHTDYNDGFVMPCAIQKRVFLAMALNQKNVFRCFSAELGYNEFSADELKAGHEWFNYVMGVIHGFGTKGWDVGGFDLMVVSDLPTGAGLSSSAALCAGLAFGINHLNNYSLDRLELARIAQYAEHAFAGVRCGLMDQYASLFGEKDSAILLDCRSLTHQYLPFHPEGYQLLLIHSRVSHHLAFSEYNNRREACESAVTMLMQRYFVTSLRDVTEEMLFTFRTQLGEERFMRCLFVVQEIARTQRAADDLRSGDWKNFGIKMFETHEGLSQAYQVSCPETDYLVDLAKASPAVLCARMMGGGFGGCTLNLIASSEINAFEQLVRKNYVAQFKKEPEFYQVTASEGVRLIA